MMTLIRKEKEIKSLIHLFVNGLQINLELHTLKDCKIITSSNVKQPGGRNILKLGCASISAVMLKMFHLSLNAVRGKVTGSLKTKDFTPSGSCMCSSNFMAICFYIERRPVCWHNVLKAVKTQTATLVSTSSVYLDFVIMTSVQNKLNVHFVLNRGLSKEKFKIWK